MAFVKLDCGILNSTIWFDRDARELFVTALLMAEPRELETPTPTIEPDSLTPNPFVIPPGWYGFVPAAGTGIIRMAGLDREAGTAALVRLGKPEMESRTPDFEGRRMVRVDGGYIILNFDKYRQKDHTSAERSKRYRERKAMTDKPASRVTNAPSRVTSRSVTQAEAEAEAEADVLLEKEPKAAPESLTTPKARRKSTVEQEANVADSTPLPLTLSTPDFRKAWTLWCQHRRQLAHRDKRKPWTATAARATLQQCAAAGPEASAAAIVRAVGAQWQGLHFDAPARQANGNGHASWAHEAPAPAIKPPPPVKPAPKPEALGVCAGITAIKERLRLSNADLTLTNEAAS